MQRILLKKTPENLKFESDTYVNFMSRLSRHWKTKELVEETGIKSQEWRIYKPG